MRRDKKRFDGAILKITIESMFQALRNGMSVMQGLDLQAYRTAYEEIYNKTSESKHYVNLGRYWYASKKRFEDITKEILSTNPKMLLDVGCGDGAYAIFLAKRRINYIAADISLYNLKRMREWAARECLEKYIMPILCDINHLPFRASLFEITLCSEVLEHLFDLTEALSEIARVTKGNVIISAPCSGGLIIDGIIGNKTAQRETERLRHVTSSDVYEGLMTLLATQGAMHVNIFTMGILRKILSKNGLMIKKTKGVGFDLPVLRNSWRYKSFGVSKILWKMEDVLLGRLPVFHLSSISFGNEFIIVVATSS